MAVLTTTGSGSTSRNTNVQPKGMPLSPIAIEVTIRLPEQSTNSRLPARIEPLEPKLPIQLTSKPDAIRLLTLPPVPIEKTGAENSPSTPKKLGIVEPTYFPTSRLTSRPRPLSEPKLQLPSGWLEAFGQTTLTLYVDATGKVDTLVIRRTNLPPELENVVRDAFQNLRFSPGEIDGIPVPSVMTIETDIYAPISNRR